VLILRPLSEDNNIPHLLLSPVKSICYGLFAALFAANRWRYFANRALTAALFSAIIQPFDGKSSENNRKETDEEILLQGCQSKE
jgi:hypothetical protein